MTQKLHMHIWKYKNLQAIFIQGEKMNNSLTETLTVWTVSKKLKIEFTTNKLNILCFSLNYIATYFVNLYFKKNSLSPYVSCFSALKLI